MFGDNENFGRVKKIYVTNTRRLNRPSPLSLSGSRSLLQSSMRRPIRASCRSGPAENSRRRALVVGHSNTVPEIVPHWRHRRRAAIGDEEFDTVYVVTVPTIGKVSVLRMKY
jgi:hypothetical protein